MKRFLLAFGLTLLTLLSLSAQSGDAQALLFTRIERNPRTAAFAGAGAASVSGMAYSAFKGAAVLPMSPGKVEGAGAFQLWRPGSEWDQSVHACIGAGVNLGRFGFSLGSAFQSGAEYEGFRPSQRVIGLGAAFAIVPEKLSVGLNARYAGETVARDPFTGANLTLRGFSADLSVLYCITKDISTTVGVSTLGNSVKGSDETEAVPQPSSAYLGGSWHPVFGSHGIELMLDGEFYFAGSATLAVGAEYSFHEMVFARAGYRLAGNYGIPSHLALGLGCQFLGIRLDVSYLTASKLLGNTFSVGLGYRF